MKLAYLDLCGFRGYRQRLRLDFADAFTIIDGRNGVGKSTIFDAVEFVLTGTLSKYDEAKASGETVADYLWWTGDGPQPRERYVEVGFSGEGEVFPLRRTQISRRRSEKTTNAREQAQRSFTNAAFAAQAAMLNLDHPRRAHRKPQSRPERS